MSLVSTDGISVELADAVSSDRYLMDYEIAAIARSLKVSVGWLFGETDDRR